MDQKIKARTWTGSLKSGSLDGIGGIVVEKDGYLFHQ